MQISDQSNAYRAPLVRIEGTRHLATQSWKSQARQYQSAIFQERSSPQRFDRGLRLQFHVTTSFMRQLKFRLKSLL